MFKYRAIKKYGKKLLPKLEKRFGVKDAYNASEIRSTVYQCNFNPNHLPLGYILFLEKSELDKTIKREFPDLCIQQYKRETNEFLTKKNYNGYLSILAHPTI